MSDNNKTITTFNMRIDKQLLMFIKKSAVEEDCTMTDLVTRCLDGYRKKVELKRVKEALKNN